MPMAIKWGVDALILILALNAGRFVDDLEGVRCGPSAVIVQRGARLGQRQAAGGAKGKRICS